MAEPGALSWLLSGRTDKEKISRSVPSPEGELNLRSPECEAMPPLLQRFKHSYETNRLQVSWNELK